MKTPKKLTPPIKDTRKELHFEIVERCTRDYHSGEKYGHWERENQCSLTKVSRDRDFVNKWDHYSYKVPDDVYDAKMLYVVTVTYSSGDSFGTSTGNMTVAYVTEDAYEALKVKNAIEREDGSWDKDFKNTPKSVNQGYSCWDGYFEQIESVDVAFLPVMG